MIPPRPDGGDDVSLESGWRDFAATVIPDDAHPFLVAKMRQAFMLGALNVMCVACPGEVPDGREIEARMAVMIRMKGELDAFTKGLETRYSRRN